MARQKYPSFHDINPAHIKRINLNGLKGRMLVLPSTVKTKKRIIYVYGMHNSIERMYATAEYLADFGQVYLPDLPGIGGMTSFYKIGLQPTLDNYADYLYTLMKTSKLTKDMTIIGFSFGSQVMTRMFQKHPDSQAWISTTVGFSAIGSKKDLNIAKPTKLAFDVIIFIQSFRIGAWFMRWIVFGLLSPIVIGIFSRVKAKMQSETNDMRKAMIAMETSLWRLNDRRSHSAVAKILFKTEMSEFTDKKIELDIHNIVTENDQYIDAKRTSVSMSKLYRSYAASEFNSKVHAPTMLADKSEVGDMITDDVKKLLID